MELAEREALAEAWWKVHGTIDPPTALQINSLAKLLAVCANEALERAAQIVEQCPAAQNPFHASNGVREAVVAIRTLKAEG